MTSLNQPSPKRPELRAIAAVSDAMTKFPSEPIPSVTPSDSAPQAPLPPPAAPIGEGVACPATVARLERLNRGQARLVAAVLDLSHARSLEEVQAVVRSAAREVTRADGATFVLRENDQCHYADEDAISPLWKGRRFPLTACISGWAMRHREAVAIEDIYADPRIPVDAYRPTFVRSLVMVPIRAADPIGAIGNYWAERHAASADEMALLQALASTTAVALENVRICAELERRVQERTRELALANEELESFSTSVSHDLRAPLRHISGYCGMLASHVGAGLDESGRRYLGHIDEAAQRMRQLIDDLLDFSRAARGAVREREVDLTSLVRDVQATFAADTVARALTWELAPLPTVRGDASLLRVVFANLLGNAVKYTRPSAAPRITVAPVAPAHPGEVVVCVRDNGAGFDMRSAHKLFSVFSRLHGEEEFEGTGVGLATVRRIVVRHGGRVWAEGQPGAGAAFFVGLPPANPPWIPVNPRPA